MSKLITIPIRKHTKVRRLSRWTLYLDPLLDTGKFITRPITDISKGLENPLNLVPPFIPFENDIMGDWAGVDFGYDPKHSGYLSKWRHPITWYKLKNRFKK
ncbi:MAG: hypothetical protein QG623_726 [Patescibacteria group bacterium]|nr:hypothetical protein [Patescibacteria group bacterium]